VITELAKNVYWVGVVDWAIRRFHGHELSTHRGSTWDDLEKCKALGRAVAKAVLA
jgi:hypothetical protein